MKYVVYLALLGVCIPGMLHMIDWGLAPRRYWIFRLLLVVVFLTAFVAVGSVVYFRAWR